jgi:hypothetical protein
MEKDVVENSFITHEVKSRLGVEVGPRFYRVDEETIKKFARITGDANPAWQGDSIIAPPTFVPNFCTLPELVEEWFWSLDCPLKQILAGGTEIETFKAVRPGDVISVTGKLIDIQERKGGRGGKLLFFVFEFLYKNQGDEIVSRGRVTLIRC